MAAQLKSSKRKRNRSGFSDINVTPLVDVMLVLLIVFMVAAPMMTVGVPVDLPKTHAAKLNDTSAPFIVTIDGEGKIFIEKNEISPQHLVTQLKLMTQNNPDAKIYVRGDKNIHYGRVMEVMGLISQGGFEKVALMAELPSK